MTLEEAPIRNHTIPRGASFECKFLVRVAGEFLDLSQGRLKAQIRKKSGRGEELITPEEFTISCALEDVIADDGVTVLYSQVPVVTYTLTPEQTASVTYARNCYYDILHEDTYQAKNYYRKGTVVFTETQSVLT